MKAIPFVILLLLLPFTAYAAKTGFGGVAGHLMEPVTVISDFVGSACIVIGITCLFGAFLRYLQFRINPLASPISTVYMLLLMGIILVFLPLTYKLTESGVPYSVSVKV